MIAKGLSSVKYMSAVAADEIYDLSKTYGYNYFCDLLRDMQKKTSLDSRQLDILIKIDFFAEFGNQRELFAVNRIFEMFKGGDAKQIRKDRIDGTELEEIVRRHSNGKTKSGADAKSYTLLNPTEIIRECEKKIKHSGMEDLSLLMKARNFNEIMGHAGFVTDRQEDRNKLYVSAVYPVKRKKDNAVFGYSIVYQSIGSGIEGRMTVFKKRYEQEPINKDDIIVCKRWDRDGGFFRMYDYEHVLV